jgi:cytoskeletal protein RodZ
VDVPHTHSGHSTQEHFSTVRGVRKKVNENGSLSPLFKKRQRGPIGKEILVRLTLRTLLAYLDDTLEPLEIKTIGQKVSESETAQELITRIKQVTRRRRITTPPATGPNSFDPNMVAEYLDNELPTEQVAELEKICLESDVHLAEVAACHQILTLVLGEPAVVPPTAKERMYALVQGREAIPFRKAATANGSAAAPTTADTDADEMFLLGLPFYRRGSWLRWALPLVAVVLFTVIGVALWQSIRGVQQTPTKSQQVAQGGNTSPEQAGKSDKAGSKDAGKDSKKDNNNPPANPSKTPDNASVKTPDNPPKDTKTGGSQPEIKTTENNPPEKKPETTTNEKPAALPIGRETPASTDRVPVGRYHTDTVGPPSLLVQRKSEKDEWSRVKPGAPVSTNDQLMSLPGYASEVWLDNGLHLLLRGHVREFTPQLLRKDPTTGEVKNEAAPMDYLQECAIVLHKPNHTDADVTLQRGRMYLSNHSMKQPGTVVVRLRFEKKVWDLTLYPGAEVVLDLLKSRRNGEPMAELNLFLLRGEAGLGVEQDNYPSLSVPGIAYFIWNDSSPFRYEHATINKQQLDHASRNLFAKRPTISSEEASGMERALKAVMVRMTVDKSPLVALKEVLDNTEQFFEHRLAIYCLAAMDEIKDLLDILGRPDEIHAPDRDIAIYALRRWLDHGRGQGDRLFNPKTEKGLLISELMYTRDEAERIMALLRDPTDEQLLSPKFYAEMAKDLTSDKVAIAELSRWWLFRITLVLFGLDLPNLKNFNAAWPRDRREAARREVEQKIRDGLLPPPESGKPAPGGGVRPAPKGGPGPRPNR